MLSRRGTVRRVPADVAFTANGIGNVASDASSPLTIGNRQPGFNRGFAGSIDEVRVYNRVLSSSEIQALADNSAPGAPTGLTITPASSSQLNLSWTRIRR